jgi:hypothetical protein
MMHRLFQHSARYAAALAALFWAQQGLVWAQTAQEQVFAPASVNMPVAAEEEGPWIEMYGVRLSSATRDSMREALRMYGVKPTREDARYWVDVYDARGLIRGASQFYLGYAAATQKLAFAEYAFKSFMDSGHTQQIVNRVTAKYGPPSETVGQLAVGAYTARWRLAEGMQIQVVREWPETSTYLKFINPEVDLEMKAELEQEFNARQKSKLSAVEAAPTFADPATEQTSVAPAAFSPAALSPAPLPSYKIAPTRLAPVPAR